MTIARPATPADADELMRLRKLMIESLDGEIADGPWLATGTEILRRRLGTDDLAAFVVDRPGGLAACAVGAVDLRLPTPGNPTALKGYVYSVSTDPAHRRKGYSRACLTALLGWYRARGVTSIDLRASKEGLALYESLGFVRTGDPAMRLRLTP